MKINILTLFPEMFHGFIEASIVKKAREKNLVEFNIVNIRDYAFNKHKTVDDLPFGGGAGMVLKPEPLFLALEDLEKNNKKGKVIYTSPQGKTFDQKLANSLAELGEITIIAGHYEGIDERVVEKKVDMEISIGDFVLTGGELPAMVISDAITRLLPGVIKKESYVEDSFYNGLLDHPHYTRPAEFNGLEIPQVLLSGHHKNIELWRKEESLRRTLERRPEIIDRNNLTKEEIKILNKIIDEKNNR